MIKERNFTMISGFGRPGCSARIDLDAVEFVITRDSKFDVLMDDPLKTSNGFTVGQRNRAFLHAALDAWIDNTDMPEGLNATDEQCARFNEVAK